MILARIDRVDGGIPSLDTFYALNEMHAFTGCSFSSVDFGGTPLEGLALEDGCRSS